MAETRTILLLGASYAGLGVAHYFAKHVYPSLPQNDKIAYRLVVADPSSHFYQRHASPRGIASEELMPDKHMFLNIADGLTQYGDVVRFIQGSATAWNPEERQVTIRSTDGKEQLIDYHALILATGTKTNSPLFSLQGTSHSENLAALSQIREKVSHAKHIVVVGGGPSGVETAGELGEALNGRAGWFSSRPSNPQAQISLYTNSDKLLPVLRASIAKQAEMYLNKVGVDVHYNTKVASTSKLEDGRVKIMLHDGEEIIADAYIPATGLAPMTEYAPQHLVDSRGYIKTNDKTLRVDEAGPRVYAVGDVASSSRNSIMDIMGMTPVLMTNLKQDLLAIHTDPNGKPATVDREFKAGPVETQLVPVGRSKGVGALFGWRLPSFFVWMIKGKNYMITEQGNRERLMGNNWSKEK